MNASESQKAFFQTLFLLCCCTFVIYQLQDSVLNSNLGKEARQPSSEKKSFSNKTSNDVKSVSNRSSTNDVKLWITMGLCWSANTKYHDKNKFPYKAAAPMAARLWHKFTPATVILQVRYRIGSGQEVISTTVMTTTTTRITTTVATAGLCRIGFGILIWDFKFP